MSNQPTHCASLIMKEKMQDSLSDKMNSILGFVNFFQRVPLVFLPSALLPRPERITLKKLFAKPHCSVHSVHFVFNINGTIPTESQKLCSVPPKKEAEIKPIRSFTVVAFANALKFFCMHL